MVYSKESRLREELSIKHRNKPAPARDPTNNVLNVCKRSLVLGDRAASMRKAPQSKASKDQRLTPFPNISNHHGDLAGGKLNESVVIPRHCLAGTFAPRSQIQVPWVRNGQDALLYFCGQ